MNASAVAIGGGLLALVAWRLSRKPTPTGDVEIGPVRVSQAAPLTDRDKQRAQLISAETAVKKALGYDLDTAELSPKNPRSADYALSIQVATDVADAIDRFGDSNLSSGYLRSLIARAKQLQH